jgi:hypothetical protein
MDEMATYLQSKDYTIQCAAGNELVWMVRKRDIPQARRLLLVAIRSETTAVRRGDFRQDLQRLKEKESGL